MTTKENILKKYSSPYNLYFRFRHFFPKILRPYIESIIFTPHRNKNTHQFDLCISLGNNCLSANSLITLKLRTRSFPFDWLYGVPLERNLDWIINDFHGFLRYKDLDFPEQVVGRDKHLRVKNLSTNTFFIHDFLTSTFSEFLTVEQKYKRRCSRLLHSCSGKSPLFLYIESNPDNIDYLSKAKHILEKLSQVKTKLNAKKVTLLIIYTSTKESENINLFQHNNSHLYLFGSQKTRPKDHKDRLELAFLIKEILKTI